MEKLKLYTICGDCGGDGVMDATSAGNPEVIDPCPACVGSGYFETGLLDGVLGNFLDDLANKVNDVLDKVNDIKEKLDE